MPTLRVNITEERGNTAPQLPDHGEERPGLFRPMGKAVHPLAFGLYYLSLNDSSFRTFSAAPCLGRFEPNAPGGGGGDDILHPKFFRPKIWVFRSVERFVFSLGTFTLFRIPWVSNRMNDTLFFKSIQSDRLLITLWICGYLVVFVEMLVSINGDKEELIN